MKVIKFGTDIIIWAAIVAILALILIVWMAHTEPLLLLVLAMFIIWHVAKRSARRHM